MKVSEALSRGGRRLRGGFKEAAGRVKEGATRVKTAGQEAAQAKVRELGDRVGEDVTRKLRAKALDLGVPGFLGAIGLGLTLTSAALLTLGLCGLLSALVGVVWLAQIVTALLILTVLGAVVYKLQERGRSHRDDR